MDPEAQDWVVPIKLSLCLHSGVLLQDELMPSGAGQPSQQAGARW